MLTYIPDYLVATGGGDGFGQVTATADTSYSEYILHHQYNTIYITLLFLFCYFIIYIESSIQMIIIICVVFIIPPPHFFILSY